MATAAELLRLTNFRVQELHPMKTMDACLEFMQRHRDHEAYSHVHLTYLAVRSFLARAYASMEDAAQRMRSMEMHQLWRLAEHLGQGGPYTLANGMLATTRLRDPADRAATGELIDVDRGLLGPYLQRQVEREWQRRQRMFRDGESEARRQGVTIDEAHARARVHHAQWRGGEHDKACAGFESLIHLNPNDAYFCNMLGVCLEALDRPHEAIVQYLYALYLDPSQEHAYTNAMKTLVGVGLTLPAADLGRQYALHVAGKDSARDAVARSWTTLARAITSICVCVRLEPDRLGSSSPEVFETRPMPLEPWLREPDMPTGWQNGGRVFISYRRSETMKTARQLEAVMRYRWPGTVVFRDETDGVGGTDWLRRIEDEIRRADLVVVLVQPDWGRTSSEIQRREVAWALRQNTLVCPLLVDGAAMPRALRGELRALPLVHGIPLRSDHFADDFRVFERHVAHELSAARDRRERSTSLRDDPTILAKAAGAGMQHIVFEDGVRGMPRFVVGRSQYGEGVDRFSLLGHWVCNSSFDGTEYALDVRIESLSGPFDGTYRVSGSGWEEHSTFHGNWNPIYDPECRKLLGLRFQGLWDGREELLVTIPLHKRLGMYFSGDEEIPGHDELRCWVSQNIDPRGDGI